MFRLVLDILGIIAAIGFVGVLAVTIMTPMPYQTWDLSGLQFLNFTTQPGTAMPIFVVSLLILVVVGAFEAPRRLPRGRSR